ncbi:MAG: LysR family transcriptional regulator [Serratia sp. (in: enterobacteria)]|uniref:LysR family transcriptional regulator n=1 Tax=Serratia sp. (in: enterobacteria) TaxID=616 RepID=UPI003F3659CF
MQTKLDLNLARILCEVIDAGSVSAAAINLKTSISAVSIALNKLRKHHNNTLFFRQGNGMMPTALALELYKLYRPALNLFDDADKLQGDDLIPSPMQKVRIATIPLFDLLLVDKFLDSPELCNGSGWDVLSISQDPDVRIERLRRKQIDLDIGSALPNDRSLLSYPVLHSGMTMICSKQHPRIKKSVTLEQFRQESLLGYIYSEEKLGVEIPSIQHNDETLLFRKFRSSSIITILLQVAKRELIVMMPSKLAPWVCERFDLRTVEHNFPVKHTVAYYAHIHRSEKNNALLQKIVNYLSELGRS